MISQGNTENREVRQRKFDRRQGRPPFTGWILAGSLLLAGCDRPPVVDPEILASLPEKVDFNYHVRPILSDRCFPCHGPDDRARKAGLRLDQKEGALETRLQSGGYAVVASSHRRSRLWQRISSDDDDYRMPPTSSELRLSEFEIALLGRWIEQGADWKPHWAFLPPRRPELPEVKDPQWVRNPVDRFILARLERAGLSPAPEADRMRLLRRVYLDLTGLPPSIEEMEAFSTDNSAEAYPRLVDRLLESPEYAERMAMEWMDVARYADSHGYHADGSRMMWPWRDWVIQAFQANLPFDRFLTWQLAGDLLPEATREQKLATAFHRNHPMTAEGGVVDEEYRVEYVIDRANTTARAFMGLTVECAQCHDHKFDPITQAEYYQLFAFFNNLEELGMTGDDGNAGPTLLLPDEALEEELSELRQSAANLETRIQERSAALSLESAVDSLRRSPVRPPGLLAHYPLDEVKEEGTPNMCRPAAPGKVYGQPRVVKGRVGGALEFDHDYEFLRLEGVGLFERTDPFSLSLWVYPQTREPYRELLGNAGHKNSYWRGYEIFMDGENRVHVRLIHARPHNYLEVASLPAIPVDDWTHVAVTYDGSSRADGVRVYFNGESAPVESLRDSLYKSILPVTEEYELDERALRAARSYRTFSGDDGIFTGRLDDIRIYKTDLTAAEVAALSDRDSLGEALDLPGQERSAAQQALIREHYLARHDRTQAGLLRKLKQLREKEQLLAGDIPELMVMEERSPPRPTFVLERGRYDAPQQQVSPGTPSVLLPYSEALPRNRLGLARWLTDSAHPLTARVTVNRYWQMYFGRGIVSTPEDFGYQGSLPTHPELLDWLAVEFVESGWDIKALQKLIVTSATYRQSSQASPEAFETDPENQLLARGPSHRLPAEMIRDHALAVSGLLVRKIGGPSVKPYQPPGLWSEKSSFSHFLKEYQEDRGEGLYRRSMYTFIRRTSPPPFMTVFDAPDRSFCVVRRQSTSTPLQALVLMNDPQLVEAARKMAERMLGEGERNTRAQIELGFRLAIGRTPGQQEVELLEELFEKELARFRKDRESAAALLRVGHSRPPSRLPEQTAALAVVANTLLNHVEAYTKP